MGVTPLLFLVEVDQFLKLNGLKKLGIWYVTQFFEPLITKPLFSIIPSSLDHARVKVEAVRADFSVAFAFKQRAQRSFNRSLLSVQSTKRPNAKTSRNKQ